ncbi:type I-C CRISPR-associated protein Cas8c/Csd1, partial [Candidatus Saccharibacteria bacterium]|nr:type I-C CRISPR-associated protein Cas8c/Csd1 [Calditrichia bacterium]NIV71691.1 type I-C CRISPR-associated protein Cas8c/Csd1 [Calditrichia bacterium]NIV98339.1 type I-C CRISPR-associated protein Cas8c/Csd1 [Candidatus Saccharibacteria bacterium]
MIAELHRSFGPSQIRGAKSTGGNLVSFNEQAYESFGKSQGYNSPIGVQSAFYYATALNYLLRPDSSQRIQVGDATTVFWAAQPDHPMETLMESLFGEPPKDDPDRGVRTVEALFKAPQTGTLPLQEDHTRFFVLGLSPNAARISVRFWHATTVGELARNIQKHFEDISICHAPYEKDYPSLFRLLVAAAVQGKSENIPPNLAGVVMKSILEGTPYPRALLATVLSRARAEQAKKDQKGRSAPNVSQPRAALIKACLNRHTRRFQPHEKEVTVSLDETNHNTGYLLGRLFAVLERTQEEANP